MKYKYYIPRNCSVINMVYRVSSSKTTFEFTLNGLKEWEKSYVNSFNSFDSENYYYTRVSRDEVRKAHPHLFRKSRRRLVPRLYHYETTAERLSYDEIGAENARYATKNDL